MAVVTEVVWLCYHQFGLVDGDDWPIELVSTNALVDAAPGSAVIATGIHTGVVTVTVDVRDDAPPDVELDSWDEVVELSVTMPGGDARLRVLMSDVPATFPSLTPHGPGPYRLRCHARGRDTSIDGTAKEPFEDYLIAIWPAPLARQVIYKETDRYGAGWHRYDLHAPDPSEAEPPPAYDPPPQEPQRYDDPAGIDRTFLWAIRPDQPEGNG